MWALAAREAGKGSCWSFQLPRQTGSVPHGSGGIALKQKAAQM